MDKVARLEPAVRAELFDATAARMNLVPGLVEKDFWVCWLLRQLYSMSQFKDRLLFKGGTTLSKVFGVIERFSEDIDLAVDYTGLGYTGDRDPATDMSRSRRARLLDEMLGSCRNYIADSFTPPLRQRLVEVLGTAIPWRLEVDADDPFIVNFSYPTSSSRVSYLRPEVRLELGTHAEFIPRGSYTITPYAALHFPAVFDDAACLVQAIKAERTFWEKVTILHQEHHRTVEHGAPSRYSRHYYDVFMLAQRREIRESALGDPHLLERVVKHKQRFYPRGWARYDLAVPATMQLAPSPDWEDYLRRDYRTMAVMLFGEPPAFDSILLGLRELEAAIRTMR